MSTQQHGSSQKLDKTTLHADAYKLLVGRAAKTAEKPVKLIGLEVEMPFVDVDTLKPIPFSGKKSITAVFNALSGKDGPWSVSEYENGKVTSLRSAHGEITLEPGGQIEFAGAARQSMTQTAEDVAAYFKQMEKITADVGLDVVPFGFHPHLDISECPYISERSRFKALKPVFDAEKGYAAWGQSCSVQVTLDSPSADKAFDAFKLGLLLQPVSAAMFANSPFHHNTDSGYKSWRRQSLQSLDSPLYTVPEELFEAGYTLKDWVAHTLEVPMSFIVRDGAYISVAPVSFSSMVGKPLPELAHLPENEQYLTTTDLLDHMTGIKPEMLLKPNLLLEFRAADLTPSPDTWLALGAFWTGIFYDEKAFKAAQDYVADWTADERQHMRKNVAQTALQTAGHGGKTMQQIALDLIAIAEDGLSRFEPAAVPMLEKLKSDVAQGLTAADAALSSFAANNGDMEATIRKNLLFRPQGKNS